VFRLAEGGGLELIEIAPGIDLQRQILARMDFAPAISPELRLMDAALFHDAPINLRERMLARPLAERISFDADSNILFVDFEGHVVDSPEDIDAIEAEVARRVEPIGGASTSSSTTTTSASGPSWSMPTARWSTESPSAITTG
jgi:propionate CoA-transferase